MIYDFYCATCNIYFEKEYKKIPKKSPSAVCTTCNIPAERYYNIPGIQFKGAGFYVNDKEFPNVRVSDLGEHARIRKEQLAEQKAKKEGL